MNIGVIGGYKPSRKAYKTAYELGRLIVREGWTLVCGGGSGVMEAACKGAWEEGGVSVGILPSSDERSANRFVSVKIPTGLGYARNILVVRASRFLIAIDGKYGTLSEIAFALNEGKKVVGINTWGIEGVVKATSPKKAIAWIRRYKKRQRKPASF